MELARLEYVYVHRSCAYTHSQTFFPPVNAARKVELSFSPGKTSYNQKEAVYLVNYDTSKCARIFGLQLRGMDEVAADMVKQFKERGWIQ